MKFKLSIKVILWLWLGLAIILGILVMSAYSKLNPDSFLVLLNQQVQRNYPGSKLVVQDMSYAFKLDFSLKIKELSVKKDDVLMGRIGKVEIRLPWWLLLFNRGSAQVNLSDLDIYVPGHNDPSTLARELEPSGGRIKVTVPGYMTDASYTIRAKDITIRELDGNRRFFNLSKLLIREFQYGKNSAFELNIPIRITHKNTKYTSELWLFGDITPHTESWALNYRGEFKTKENSEKLEFDDLVIDGKATVEPSTIEIVSNYSLMVEKKEIGKGKFVYEGNLLGLDATFTDLPIQYLSLVGEEVKNPFWVGLEGNAQGNLKFARKLGPEDVTTLAGKLNFVGNFSIPNSEPIAGTWQLNFENGKWETSFLSPKHEVSFYRRAAINFKEGSVTQYSQEIGFTDIDLGLPLKTVEDLGTFMGSSPQDYHSTFISIKNCKLGDRIVEGFFRLGILPDQRFYQAELVDDSSKLIFNYQDKQSQHQLDATFSKFPLTKSHKFLSPFFSVEDGIVNGRLEGKWAKHWMDGTWKSKLDFSGLKSPQGSWFDLVIKIASVFSFDPTPFPAQTVDFAVSKNILKLNSFSLNGPDPAVMSGSMSANAKKSYLTLNYPKNKKWKPIRKEAGTSIESKEEVQ